VFAEAGQRRAQVRPPFEQFAKVSVKNHHHSAEPEGDVPDRDALETVMGAEMIAYPNTKLMCS